MKKWTFPLLASLITACTFTPYLWQQERDGVSAAQIHKVDDNRYYITSYRGLELEVFQLDSDGDFQLSSGCIPLVELLREGVNQLYDYVVLDDGGIIALAELAEKVDGSDSHQSKLLITRYE
ncbi:MAG: hypothetical protein MI867_24085 [Pseudomonadales bacterium]|nr:hypothetical protein [Pseudomonadales bacterium]